MKFKDAEVGSIWRTRKMDKGEVLKVTKQTARVTTLKLSPDELTINIDSNIDYEVFPVYTPVRSVGIKKDYPYIAPSFRFPKQKGRQRWIALAFKTRSTRQQATEYVVKKTKLPPVKIAHSINIALCWYRKHGWLEIDNDDGNGIYKLKNRLWNKRKKIRG